MAGCMVNTTKYARALTTSPCGWSAQLSMDAAPLSTAASAAAPDGSTTEPCASYSHFIAHLVCGGRWNKFEKRCEKGLKAARVHSCLPGPTATVDRMVTLDGDYVRRQGVPSDELPSTNAANRAGRLPHAHTHTRAHAHSVGSPRSSLRCRPRDLAHLAVRNDHRVGDVRFEQRPGVLTDVVCKQRSNATPARSSATE